MFKIDYFELFQNTFLPFHVCDKNALNPKLGNCKDNNCFS